MILDVPTHIVAVTVTAQSNRGTAACQAYSPVYNAQPQADSAEAEVHSGLYTVAVLWFV